MILDDPNTILKLYFDLIQNSKIDEDRRADLIEKAGEMTGRIIDYKLQKQSALSAPPPPLSNTENLTPGDGNTENRTEGDSSTENRTEGDSGSNVVEGRTESDSPVDKALNAFVAKYHITTE